jgi:hypothetical protein
MKKKSLFLVAIGALLLSACDYDEVVQDKIPATLKLTITGTNVDTRSFTAPSPTQAEENTVNRVTIGLFKPGGATDVITELLPGDLTVSGTTNLIYDATVQGYITGSESADRDIVVVINAPAKHFAGATTKIAFITRALSLTQVKNNLPMSGVGTTTLVANQTVGPVTIQAARMVARVDLQSLSSAFDPAGQYANASFIADEIFMYNAMNTSTIDCATTQIPSHGWLQDPVPIPPILYNPNLGDEINQTFTGSTTYNTKHYFYTFANLFMDNLNYPNNLNGSFMMATRLVIGGIFKVNAADPGDRVYYPVILNRVLQSGDLTATKGIGIKRNTIYQISATIKNKGGVTPTTIIDPATLGVKIDVLDWEPTVPQDAEF